MGTGKKINEYLKRLKNKESGLDEFFKEVSGYIKFIAFRYLFDKSLVADVVMNTFCKILENIGTFNERLNGKAWISKIAKNEAFTANNTEKKHRYVSFDKIGEDVACTVDCGTDLELIYDINNALDKLDEQDRQIVELHFFCDMTFKQIASKLGIHATFAYRRYRQAIRQIEKEIF